MGEAVSKVADPVTCCGARKPDIKDGPHAAPKSQAGGGGGMDMFIGGETLQGLLGRTIKLDPGQLVISDACYKGNLDEVGPFLSCAPRAAVGKSRRGGGAPRGCGSSRRPAHPAFIHAWHMTNAASQAGPEELVSLSWKRVVSFHPGENGP